MKQNTTETEITTEFVLRDFPDYTDEIKDRFDSVVVLLRVLIIIETISLLVQWGIL